MMTEVLRILQVLFQFCLWLQSLFEFGERENKQLSQTTSTHWSLAGHQGLCSKKLAFLEGFVHNVLYLSWITLVVSLKGFRVLGFSVLYYFLRVIWTKRNLNKESIYKNVFKMIWTKGKLNKKSVKINLSWHLAIVQC
jgi:hypothetical protein